jgi:hypothetical protein
MTARVFIVLLAAMAVLIRADVELIHKSFNGPKFDDLDGITNFLNDLGWTALAVKEKKAPISQCNNINVVGGFGVFGKGTTLVKSFHLPAHYKLQLKLQIVRYDSR